MTIQESDISILIPTYRYRDKIGRAVESAIASGAGEIIVTDDCSRDGTMELLSNYSDPRLRTYENAKNMGLWENHLEALNYASKPWIKFIQADDYLLPDGLAAFAEAADDDTTVVWSCAVVKDDETGEVMQYQDLNEPRLLDGDTLLEACIFMGWVLGSPSHIMARADAIERDPAAWETKLSADVVLGTVAAARGNVALLPPGAIGQGAHAKQDAKTQGQRLGLERLVTTSAYLKARPEPSLQRFATLWAAINRPTVLRTAISGIMRGSIPLIEGLRQIFRNLELSHSIRAEHSLLKAARIYRRNANTPHDVAAVLDKLKAAQE